MTEIRFYHLERTELEQVLPQLVTKALSADHRIIVKTSNEQETQRLNTHLWTYNPNSFLPHGTKKEGNPKDQPVWITAEDENPNNADMLILTHDQNIPDNQEFALICYIFDGSNSEILSKARARWKTLKNADANLSYWQQSPQGCWEKKA
ncbi:MAG: DNA polymerase III subunit chi [Rhodospirillales bacterium]|nr:DNA polymerase III subunit chi [Alphaproteobacteria bacterium]USO05336.1 MAG: DNA polymerase III subunit chi [Rhodospirillales bacterium]